MKFSYLGISQQLEENVKRLGYSQPTPIQAQAIPQILCGHDVFACAQTGTGKTASFLLPVIDILTTVRPTHRLPKAIILEPTRELAAQVFENFQSYAEGTKISAALLVGGESMFEQDRLLKRGVDLLIATPGRLIDLFERGRMILAGVKVLVIDEADRMLDMGFIPDIERLVSVMPLTRQTLLFSATISDEIRELGTKYLVNPKEITVTRSAKTAETIDHFIVYLDPSDKRRALRTILRHQDNPGATIVFCNRKKDVGIVTASLKKHGFEAEALHGDLNQSVRNKTLEDFKSGDNLILVASDVAARGIDVENLNLVINFDVPVNSEDYVHRIGRTGRAGNTGMAVTFVTNAEKRKLKGISKLIQQDIPEMPLVLDEEKPKEKPIRQERLWDDAPVPLKPIVGFGDFVPAFMLRPAFPTT